MQLRTTRPGCNPAFPNDATSLKDARVLQNLHYTYDPVGNVTAVYDDAFEPAFFDNQHVTPVSRYTYDSLYRLIEATGRESSQVVGAPGQFESATARAQFPVTAKTLRTYTQEYTYDEVGNILEMAHRTGASGSWTRHYTYTTNSNRLNRSWEGNNTTAATRYAYDEHGNALNLLNVPATRQMRWNRLDMIRALDLQGGGWAHYNYDSAQKRTRKVIGNTAGVKQWERIYLGGMERYRRYSNGAVVEEIESFHLFAGEQRVLLIEDVLQTDNANLGTGPLYRYQYSNHVGSACLEIDDQARIISYRGIPPVRHERIPCDPSGSGGASAPIPLHGHGAG